MYFISLCYMYIFDFLTLFQWSVVGDTFPVGCAFSDQIVFGLDSFKDNPDIIHEIYR